jgi:L-fuconolactonase
MRQAIVDSHIHFWDTQRLRYDWLARVPAIQKPFLPADLAVVTHEVDLQGIVFVQADAACEQGLAEAEWVESLAGEEPVIRGIVAFAPVEEGEAVRPALAALARLPLVKGIRQLIQGKGLGYCVQPDFVAGVQLLPKYGFSFDLCIYHPQMEDAIRLVEQCPDVMFVLDHFGKPGVKDGLMEPWATQLRTLAHFPNVMCKISGLATEADHQHWSREQLRPYIEHAITVFGPERVLYGGDWPVSTLAVGWQKWIETINWATPNLDDEARYKLFVANAERFYRLR